MQAPALKTSVTMLIISLECNQFFRVETMLAMSKKKLLPTASAPVETAFLLFELFFIKVE